MTFYIPGIFCEHCVKTIKKELCALEEVISVNGLVKARGISHDGRC